MTIHILLPVHNRKDITLKFVDNLRQQTYGSYHLILIDDGSVDRTADFVQQVFPDCTIITGKGEWWWAGALQQGYFWIKNNPLPADDLVLIINDDTEIPPNFLEIAIQLIHPQMMLKALGYSCHSYTLIDQGITVNWKKLDFPASEDIEKIDCCSTRGLFLRVDDFLRTGGFKPKLLPHYGSDYEYTIRCHRLGLRIVTPPELKLFFDEKTTGFQHETLQQQSTCQFIKNIFSIKYAINPIYYSIFILLSCPKSLILINLLRLWKKTIERVIRHSLKLKI